MIIIDLKAQCRELKPGTGASIKVSPVENTASAQVPPFPRGQIRNNPMPRGLQKEVA